VPIRSASLIEKSRQTTEIWTYENCSDWHTFGVMYPKNMRNGRSWIVGNRIFGISDPDSLLGLGGHFCDISHRLASTPWRVPCIRENRDHRDNAKSSNFWGKSFFVDIYSRVGPMSIILGSLLDTVDLYRSSRQRTKSVTISGL
jgi:hypothetical protein